MLHGEGCIFVCIYFKMCSKLIKGWEASNWSSLCVGLGCAICHLKPLLVEDGGFYA